MLNMFTGIRCGSDGYNDFDLMYMSELDPTWDDPDLAFLSILRQPWLPILWLKATAWPTVSAPP